MWKRALSSKAIQVDYEAMLKLASKFFRETAASFIAEIPSLANFASSALTGDTEIRQVSNTSPP
jgi:hypothetical protein